MPVATVQPTDRAWATYEHEQRNAGSIPTHDHRDGFDAGYVFGQRSRDEELLETLGRVPHRSRKTHARRGDGFLHDASCWKCLRIKQLQQEGVQVPAHLSSGYVAWP